MPKEKTVEQDGDTYTTTYAYNTNPTSPGYSYGNPTRVELDTTVGDSDTVTETTYTHNRNKWILGLPERVVVDGRETMAYDYDSRGRVTTERKYGETYRTFTYHTATQSKGAPYAVRDALNRVVYLRQWKAGTPQLIEYNDGTETRQTVDANGWLLSTEDKLGNISTYEYDPMGRPTKMTPPQGGQYWRPTTVSYDFSGEGAVQTIRKGNARTDITYDAMLRPVLETTQETATGWVSHVNTRYDALGRVAFTSQPSASPTETAGVDYSYDALGRKAQDRETVAPHATTTYEYLSDNRLRMTDPAGFRTDTYRYGWDGPDRGATRAIYRYGGQAGTEKTYTSRNVWGELTEVKREGNVDEPNSRQFMNYDSRGRMCRYRTKEGNSTLMAYNDAGEMTAYSKGTPLASGCAAPTGDSVVTLERDDMGRVTKVDYADPATPDIVRNYDARDLLSVIRGDTRWDYRHNELGMRYEEKLTIDGRSFKTNRYYNANGHELARRYPTKHFVRWDPDAMGRATAMRHRLGGTAFAYRDHADNFTYHPNGALSHYALANGLDFDQTFDVRQLPKSVKVSRPGFTAMRLDYAYDPRGKVTRIVDGVDADKTRDFTYDGLGQLVTATGPEAWGQGSYTYDLMGNLRSKTMLGRTLTLGYDNRHRLKTVTSTRDDESKALAYDPRGNVVRMGAQDFTYDMSDQPVRADGRDGTGVSTYVYDGNLKRVKSVVDGRVHYSVYLSDGELVHTEDVDAGVERDYVRGAGRLLAVYGNGEPEYQHTDHLGTVQTATLPDGTATFQEHFTPYGESMGRANLTEHSLGLTGHLRDRETGLTYMQARYYDPMVGRFLSIDPVTFGEDGRPGMVNRYSYVLNDPLNLWDPNGEVGIKTTSDSGHTTVTLSIAFTGPGSSDTKLKNNIIQGLNSLPTPSGHSIVAKEVSSSEIGNAGVAQLHMSEDGYFGSPCAHEGSCASSIGGDDAYLETDTANVQGVGVHEILHTAGAIDGYEGSSGQGADRTAPTGYNRPKNDIMSQRPITGAVVGSKTMQEIVDAAILGDK